MRPWCTGAGRWQGAARAAAGPRRAPLYAQGWRSALFPGRVRASAWAARRCWQRCAGGRGAILVRWHGPREGTCMPTPPRISKDKEMSGKFPLHEPRFVCMHATCSPMRVCAHPAESLKVAMCARRMQSRARPCTPHRACRMRSWRRWRAAGGARRAHPLQGSRYLRGGHHRCGAWCPGKTAALPVLVRAVCVGTTCARVQRHRLRLRGQRSRAHRRIIRRGALPAYQIRKLSATDLFLRRLSRRLV